jgi:membrane-bound lytic murein transglycosylase D
MKIVTALLFAAVFPVAAQIPQVPHKMDFAGITLIIREDARKEIQEDVNALTKSPKHYNIKVERAKSYFPLIEKVFAEEKLPDDFKYLALQESALIADAVSVSNAVGFWQFKDFTAMEMGLRVDREVDERLNIVSSSRAAARYIKKNNTFFDNWVYALQAYQMGAGGVMKSVKDTQAGVARMEIDSKTYWYVKKYLAHKIAYEPALGGKGQVELLTYENKNGKPLAQIAQEVGVSEDDLLAYNKWTKSGKVPADRAYVVAIPVIGATNNNVANALVKNEVKTVESPTQYLKIPAAKKRINGVLAIQANSGETLSTLAARADVSLAKFLRYNDLDTNAKIIPGEYYFLGKKRGRAEDNFHKVTVGEDLWLISQHYGVKLKKLRKFNRLRNNDPVFAGNMLYLASTRPASEEFTKSDTETVAVDNRETFGWDVNPGSTETRTKDSVFVPPVVVEAPSTVVIPVVQPVLEDIDSSENLQVNAITEVTPNIESPAPKEEILTNNTPKKSEHTVQVKETLYSIAKIYNVGVMDLVKWNNLDLQQGIKVGQILKVSDIQSVSAQTASNQPLRDTVHEVKSSDTLYSIARLYGVTIKDLMDWNGKKDFSLSVGEKLKIQQRQ